MKPALRKKLLTPEKLAVKVKIEEWIKGAALEGMECGLDSSIAGRHQLKVTIEFLIFALAEQ